jgi:hypothetical protein
MIARARKKHNPADKSFLPGTVGSANHKSFSGGLARKAVQEETVF